MTALYRIFFDPQRMVKDSLKLGKFPSAKTAYTVAFSTAWAAIAETFLVSLIGMADTIMVGGEGPDAIAAVGIATQPRYLVQTLILAMNIAITAICARRRGEGDREGAVSCLKQGLLLCCGSSVLLTLLFLPLTGTMIHFISSDTDSYKMAYDYLFILILGMPLSNLSLTISSAQRGIGQTRASFYINMTANVVNIIFNYLLINGVGMFPKMGVKGAAIATVIGYAAGLLVAVLMVLDAQSYLFVGEREGWKLHKATLKSIYQVTSGSFVEQMFLRFGFLMYAKIVAGLPKMMAAHQIFMNIVSLSFSFGDGFGISASSLVGRCLGEERPDLSIMYGKVCQRMSMASSLLLSVVYLLAGSWMVRAFTESPDILAMSHQIFPIMAFIVFGQGGQMVFMGALRGAGDTKYTAIISMVSIMILRPLVGYLLAYPLGLGLVGAWLGITLDQYLRLLFTHHRFSSGKWASIQL